MNSKIKHSLFLLLVLSFTCNDLLAQDIKVKAKLDTFAIEIGDQIWLNLSAELDKQDKIQFPVLKDTIIKGIEIVQINPMDTQVLENKRIILSQKYLVTAFEDSLFAIPPFAFKTSSDTLLTNSLVLGVRPVKMDSTELAKIDTSQVFDVFDIKGPINTPWTLKEFLQLYYPYILVILGVALLSVLLIIYFNRRAKNKPFIKLPEKPKEPAHVIALRALDELKAKKLWQSGKEKEYYLEITDIIRAYIEARYDIPTFERTSHELIEAIKHMKLLDKNSLNELNHLLTLADLAKFAKYKPLPNENDLCLKDAYHFVEITKLVETPKLVNENLEAIKETTEMENQS